MWAWVGGWQVAAGRDDGVCVCVCACACVRESQDVLTAGELVTVLEDMMGGAGTREVFEEFKQFLGFRQDPPFKYRSGNDQTLVREFEFRIFSLFFRQDPPFKYRSGNPRA